MVEEKYDTYVEVTGTATMILDRAFRGLGEAILSCFTVFSASSGVVVRVHFKVLALKAAALLWQALGSCDCLERRSVRAPADGEDSTSSLLYESSFLSSLSYA